MTKDLPLLLVSIASSEFRNMLSVFEFGESKKFQLLLASSEIFKDSTSLAAISNVSIASSEFRNNPSCFSQLRLHHVSIASSEFRNAWMSAFSIVYKSGFNCS